jgi:hypothetical protein
MVPQLGVDSLDILSMIQMHNPICRKYLVHDHYSWLLAGEPQTFSLSTLSSVWAGSDANMHV